MIFAADYPFMDVFWSMLIFFVFVAWLFVLVVLLNDIFRRHDLSGFLKAAWTVLLLVLPIVGPITYLVMNHHGIAVRVYGDTEGTREQAGYLAGTTNGAPSAEIDKAQRLLDSGAITQMEFEAIRSKAVA